MRIRCSENFGIADNNVSTSIVAYVISSTNFRWWWKYLLSFWRWYKVMTIWMKHTFSGSKQVHDLVQLPSLITVTTYIILTFFKTKYRWNVKAVIVKRNSHNLIPLDCNILIRRNLNTNYLCSGILHEEWRKSYSL